MQPLKITDIMNRFELPRMTMLFFQCDSLEDTFRRRVLEGQGGTRLDNTLIDLVKEFYSSAKGFGEDCGFSHTSGQAQVFLDRFEHEATLYDCSAMSAEMRNMHAQMVKDMYTFMFVQVDESLKEYVETEHPFGEIVSKAFPSALNDLREAGNCLAVECNTAAAFHLMRATEVGLWELGRDRQIPLAKSGKIEFAQWGEIIRELETAIQAIQQWPNSQVKEDAHRFYNAAIVEVRAFNDGWRRHSAHPRPHMPKMSNDEAIALWGHVSRFMVSLASKISEGKYTPLVWT